jgi:hypothetical protein
MRDHNMTFSFEETLECAGSSAESEQAKCTEHTCPEQALPSNVPILTARPNRHRRQRNRRRFHGERR